MIGRWERRWRAVLRWVSRNEWLVHALRLPVLKAQPEENGLVMLQIDGLARSQFERALARGRMPFLRKLIQRDGYRLHTMYSGLPATTPAVQGELFYGVRRAVPAFGFRDHRTGELVRMFDTHTALAVQKRLQEQGAGLLEGGSAYCNIYSGGAAEPHFCAATMGWGKAPRSESWSAVVAALIWHGWSVVRILTLTVLEFFIALYDCVRGAIARRDWYSELKFVASRVLVSVGLRELTTIAASLDATRGVKVIHLNFLGYDEQAHRRGPASAFAHWTLRGIDEAIQRIWTAAVRSGRRDYDVWIYSDHGQSRTLPYESENGRTIHDAVAAVFGRHARGHESASPRRGGGTQFERARWLGPWFNKRFGQAAREQDSPQPTIEVVAMGPVGYIYPRQDLSLDERRHYAEALVRDANVPLVLAAGDNGQALAWTAGGHFVLPDQAAELLGDDHPFLADVAGDLAALCHHPDAGALTICGWRREGRHISFPLENGAHAGPGAEETAGFALLPPDAPLDASGPYFRPMDLRIAALSQLGRRQDEHPAPLSTGTHGEHANEGSGAEKVFRRGASKQQRETLRILTYNAHSCLGMDGRLSTSRIARVIAQADADVVALQELDVGRMRSNGDDQAQEIARKLEMEFHFHPALRLEEELYGDAVLSRHPMRLVRAAALPGLAARPGLEPRGALWVALSLAGREIQLLNTHLGLVGEERARQVEALLGRDWLAHPDCREPVILCGDMNALPNSRVYRQLCGRLRDAQLALSEHRPRRTYWGRYPLGRIDHVFLSGDLEVVRVEVIRSELVRVASDHLPLVVELRFKQV